MKQKSTRASSDDWVDQILINLLFHQASSGDLKITRCQPQLPDLPTSAGTNIRLKIYRQIEVNFRLRALNCITYPDLNSIMLI